MNGDISLKTVCLLFEIFLDFREFRSTMNHRTIEFDPLLKAKVFV